MFIVYFQVPGIAVIIPQYLINGMYSFILNFNAKDIQFNKFKEVTYIICTFKFKSEQKISLSILMKELISVD